MNKQDLSEKLAKAWDEGRAVGADLVFAERWGEDTEAAEYRNPYISEALADGVG